MTNDPFKFRQTGAADAAIRTRGAHCRRMLGGRVHALCLAPVLAWKSRPLPVADSIGIEPRFVDRVFEMFYRLHNEDEYEGTGIGLTVCRKIINDHGGKIWIDGDYAAGTRINMSLIAESSSASRAPLSFLF